MHHKLLVGTSTTTAEVVEHRQCSKYCPKAFQKASQRNNSLLTVLQCLIELCIGQVKSQAIFPIQFPQIDLFRVCPIQPINRPEFLSVWRNALILLPASWKSAQSPLRSWKMRSRSGWRIVSGCCVTWALQWCNPMLENRLDIGYFPLNVVSCLNMMTFH